MTPLAIVARAARYIAPIAVLSAIVMAPIAWFAFGVPPPANPKQATVVLRLVWVVAASGMLSLLVLVAALAPIVASERVSQLAALGRGVRGLVRAIVPAMIVLCAVAMGLVALAVPGVLLFALFVFAPASDAGGIGAKLADSVAIVKERWRAVALVIGATMVVLAAVVAVQQIMLPIPLGKTPPRAQLVMFPNMMRLTAIAIVGLVPMAAVALAAIFASTRRR